MPKQTDDANYDVASQASSRRSRASGVGVDVANSSKQLVFSEPLLTRVFTRYFPIFPILMGAKNAGLQILSLLSLLVFLLQHLGLLLNPHFSDAWGDILGGTASDVLYGFDFALYDPSLVSSAGPIAVVVLNCIVLAFGVCVVGCILSQLRGKEDSPLVESNRLTGSVARAVLSAAVGPLFLPITLLSISGATCGKEHSVWMYPNHHDGKCWGVVHVVSFVTGMLNILILLPLLYLRTVCVYEYYPLSDNFLAKRHSFLDKMCFVADVFKCALFPVCVGFDVPTLYVAIYCCLSGILVCGYMFFLPYFDMGVNRFFVFVHSLEMIASLFLAVTLNNFTMMDADFTAVVFLGFGCFVAVCLVLLTDYRANPLFFMALRKSETASLHSSLPAEQKALEGGDGSEADEDEAPVFQVNEDEVRRLPYPQGLVSSLDFSPYIAINAQVVESITRQQLNNVMLGGDQGAPKRTITPVLEPLICRSYLCADPCLAAGYLDIFARRFGLAQVTEMMLLFAANIYARAQCTFIREPFVLLTFTNFITCYLPGLSFMGVDLLKLALQNRCSVEEQFRGLKQANDLRTALGIRTHAHSIRCTQARATHGRILQLMNRFWVKLTEPSVNIKEVADVADHIRKHRRIAIDQFDSILEQQQSIDPQLLRRLGDFFSQVLMADDAAQECYGEARDIYEMRQARSMRGTRQHTSEVDVASITERMRQLLRFHSAGGGVLSTKANASSVVQTFSVTLGVLFLVLAAACALQIYLVCHVDDELTDFLKRIRASARLSLLPYRMSGLLLGTQWSGSQTAFVSAIRPRVVILITEFLSNFKFVSKYAARSTHQIQSHLISLFSIPYYNELSRNTAGFSLWGLTESYIQAVQNYIDQGTPLPHSTMSNYDEEFSVDAGSVVSTGFKAFVDIETQNKYDSKSTLWVALFLIIFVLNMLVLAGAYASIIFVVERASVGRVFTYQLFTLIPYDSLEKLATEAKERFHQIHMEKTVRGGAAPRTEHVVNDEAVKEGGAVKVAPAALPYMVADDVKVVSCLKPSVASPGSTRKADRLPRKAVTFNPVVEVVGGNADANKGRGAKVNRDGERSLGLNSGMKATPKVSKEAKKERRSFGAVRWLLGYFGVALVCVIICCIALGFTLFGKKTHQRNLELFIKYQNALNLCSLNIPKAVELSVRFMKTTTPVYFQQSQELFADCISAIPTMLGIDLDEELISTLVSVQRLAKEMDNITIDACTLAAAVNGVSLSYWNNIASRTELTLAELSADLQKTYPDAYAVAQSMATVATSMAEEELYAFAILSKALADPLSSFYTAINSVYSGLHAKQVSTLKFSQTLCVVALCAACVGAIQALVFGFSPLQRIVKRYLSVTLSVVMFVAFGAVIGLCIAILTMSSSMDTHYEPNAKALTALTKYVSQAVLINFYSQGYTFSIDPLLWFEGFSNRVLPAEELTSFITKYYLTEEVTAAYKKVASAYFIVQRLSNITAALTTNSMQTVMNVEAPMTTSVTYSHWDFSAQPDYEEVAVWSSETTYYSTSTDDLTKTADEQYTIAFTVATGAQYYNALFSLSDSLDEMFFIFTEGERSATEQSITDHDRLIFVALGMCVLPLGVLIYVGWQLVKSISESFTTNSSAKSASTDQFKYGSIQRRVLYGLTVLAAAYTATFGVAVWVSMTGYAYSEQLLISAEITEGVSRSLTTLRKVLSSLMTYTTAGGVAAIAYNSFSYLSTMFDGMKKNGVPIGLEASDMQNEIMFGKSDGPLMRRIMTSYFMSQCSRFIASGSPMDLVANNDNTALGNTVAGGLADWATYMGRAAATVSNTDSTLTEQSTAVAPLATLANILLAGAESAGDALLDDFTNKNDFNVDILLALAIVSLVLTVLVFLVVGVPTIYRLHDEEGAVRTLLQIIPANVRDEVPAVQQHVETGQISGSSEVYRTFEQNEKLLQNILPAKIAMRLKSGEQPIADTHECVTILFTDFVGFTKRSSTMQAREIVDFLNEVFLEFDTVVELLTLEKIKTIGDAFFMAGGLDPHVSDHALRVVEAGIMFFDALDEHNKRHPSRVPLQMRLGVHSGPVVAGVIGIKKVAFDLWGESVEIANAMESTGVPGYVHISETTAAFVRGMFRLEPRGELPREKEHIPENMPKTFLVTGRELPTPYMHLRRPRLMPTNLSN